MIEEPATAPEIKLKITTNIVVSVRGGGTVRVIYKHRYLTCECVCMLVHECLRIEICFEVTNRHAEEEAGAPS